MMCILFYIQKVRLFLGHTVYDKVSKFHFNPFTSFRDKNPPNKVHFSVCLGSITPEHDPPKLRVSSTNSVPKFSFHKFIKFKPQ